MSTEQPDGPVTVLLAQPDGRILIGGGFGRVDGARWRGVARLHSDGSLDRSFIIMGSGASERVNALALQSDGSILVGGSFQLFNGEYSQRLVWLSPGGSVKSFIKFGIVGEGSINTLSTEFGRLWAGGSFTNYAGLARPGVVRLHGAVAMGQHIPLTLLGVLLVLTGCVSPLPSFREALEPGRSGDGVVVGSVLLQLQERTAMANGLSFRVKVGKVEQLHRYSFTAPANQPQSAARLPASRCPASSRSPSPRR